MSALPFRLAVFTVAAALAALPVRAAEFIVTPLVVPEMKAVFGQVESRIVLPARARIGGEVRALDVGQGDEVAEGQVIATIVDDKMTLQLRAAEARLDALDSQLANARTQLERTEQLRASGTVAQASLDTARTQFEVVTNQVAAAVAEKAVIEESTREGEVRAPATGRVLTVPVTPGSVVMAGEEIARIAPGPYYLRLSLPERHAAQIVEGSVVLVGARGLDPSRGEPSPRPFTGDRGQPPAPAAAPRTGRIVKVYPEIIEGRVTADVDVAGLGDYFVHERTLVSIPVGTRTVLVVPPEAVSTRHGVDYVRVATEAGPLDVAVILGETVSTGESPLVEILTGLRAGDRAIMP